jgi:hypothetical protein
MMNNANSHCMTLRIPKHLDTLIESASYDRRLSKSQWVRAAILEALRLQAQASNPCHLNVGLSSDPPKLGIGGSRHNGPAAPNQW